MVLGPIARIISRSDWSKPRIIAVMPTIDVMPMTTPRTVSPERILFVRTVSKAIVTTSQNRAARRAMAIEAPAATARSGRRRPISFAPQRFDGIEAGGQHRRIQAEEEADERRDADAERDRPRLDGRGNRREGRDREGDTRAENRADDA